MKDKNLPPACFAVVIEDNESVARVFKAAVERAGFETEVIEDGQAALERLAVSTPQVIVLDLHLPFVSGKDVLAFIRSENRLARSWVILATADVLAAKELERKVEFVLIKPCGFHELHDLAKLLKARLEKESAPAL